LSTNDNIDGEAIVPGEKERRGRERRENLEGIGGPLHANTYFKSASYPGNPENKKPDGFSFYSTPTDETVLWHL